MREQLALFISYNKTLYDFKFREQREKNYTQLKIDLKTKCFTVSYVLYICLIAASSTVELTTPYGHLINTVTLLYILRLIFLAQQNGHTFQISSKNTLLYLMHSPVNTVLASFPFPSLRCRPRTCQLYITVCTVCVTDLTTLFSGFAVPADLFPSSVS